MVVFPLSPLVTHLATILHVFIRSPPGPGPDWSTLIGRGPSLPRSHWSGASQVMLAPAILCHKEPACSIQSPLLVTLERKIPPFGVFWLLLAGSYGIRIVGFHARKGPIKDALMP